VACGQSLVTMRNELLETRSDAASVRRSLDDPRAFGAFFDRHFDDVYAYAARRVGRDQAEEIAAETFVRAFDGRRRDDLQREDARPWLLGIATNLLCRHWRNERRRIAAFGCLAEIREPSPDDPPATGELLASALDGLPRRDRETLFLFVWADLSYQEIASALEIPVGTVRSRIARARRLLRDRLGAPAPGDSIIHVNSSQESRNV